MHENVNMTPYASTLYRAPLGDSTGGWSIIENQDILSLTSTRQRNFNSSHDIVRYMRSLGFSSVYVQVYNPIINPPMNFDYIHALFLQDGHIAQRYQVDHIVWRAVNDVRSLESYERCWRALSNITSKQSLNDDNFSFENNMITTTHHHDNTLVIRAGEDAILNLAIPLHDLILPKLALSQSGADMIVSIPCETARGHANDQIDFFNLSVAKAYLLIPYSSSTRVTFLHQMLHWKLFFRKFIAHAKNMSVLPY